MRIAEITRVASRANGGVFFAQTGLFSEVMRQGDPDLILKVFGASDRFTAQERPQWGKASLETFRPWLSDNIAFSPLLLPALRRFKPDVLHSHGLWHYPAWASLMCHRNAGIPLVVSPHGMLDPWALALSKLKKRITALLFQNAQLRAASVVHALCQSEAKAIRAYGIWRPIAVIPNGVFLPEMPNAPATAQGQCRTLLFLGRLHPKKGLEPLMLAWSLFKDRIQEASEWRLRVAGWDEAGMEAQLRQAISGSSAAQSVEFAGPLWGDAKSTALGEADAFILPSHSEGLPMAVLEAWAQAKPVLMSQACNLPEGFAEGAAWEAEPDVESILAALLRLARASTEELQAVGKAGRGLVERRFSWHKIAADMLRVYAAVASRQAPPEDLLYHDI